MKYMCLECRRIWELRTFAAECCQLAVFPLYEEDVVPCTRNGCRCEDDDCPDCQGTGWKWISAEAYKKVTGA